MDEEKEIVIIEGIKKKILKRGNGEKPKDGSTVTGESSKYIFKKKTKKKTKKKKKKNKKKKTKQKFFFFFLQFTTLEK